MRSVFVAIVASVAAVTTTALADGKRDMTVLNRTGSDIAEIYVSPAGAARWNDNVMDQEVLQDGDLVSVHLSEDNACVADVMVVFDDEETVEWSGLDLCRASSVALRHDRSARRTWAEHL
ncbi:hypothetical protein [Azospirillum canadense]|uniref:hypothetical protein n=1 Tax=Azospirillum canadense TaxID=403962 RepID=UPI002226D768|nr:hypothetical protein [Azospirillum canadense]MCW2241779.1 hypothetical protein [Azospirillum canadense]